MKHFLEVMQNRVFLGGIGNTRKLTWLTTVARYRVYTSACRITNADRQFDDKQLLELMLFCRLSKYQISLNI